MKACILSIALIAFGSHAHSQIGFGIGPMESQCTATIAATDKVADVQAKLNCFAAENAKLKEALADTRQQLTDTRQQLTNEINAPAIMGVSAFNPSQGNPQTCMANTRLSVAKRNGYIAAEQPGAMALHIGKNAVLVVCQSMVPAYVIVASRSTQEGTDLKDQLVSEIFSVH